MTTLVYFVQGVEGGTIKIGTSVNVPSRVKQLESHYKQPLTVLATMPGGRAEERALHARFAHLRFGKSEQFRPEPDLLAFINRPLFVNANPVVEAMASDRKPVRLTLSPSDHDWLAECAASVGLSMSSYVRMVVIEAIRAEQAKGFHCPSPGPRVITP